MRPKLRPRSAVLALTLAAAAALATQSHAQQKLVLKASDVHPAGYPTVVAVEHFGDKLAKATNGRITRADVRLDAARRREGGDRAGAGRRDPARPGQRRRARARWSSDLNVFNLPFLFRNTAHMQKVIDGPIGQELLDKVTGNANAGLVGLCWMDAGARSLYDTKKPIKSIADLKGLKVRVMGNPMFVDMMNALGGNGVAMGYDQVFSALQTGVVDGAENNPPSFVFDNHYQVAKYYTLTEHLIVPEILVLSRRTWDALSAEDRELVKKFAREAQAEERGLWTAYEKQAIDKAKAAGIEIIEIADKAPFQAAVKPVWDKYGPRFADLIKRIQAVD